MSTFHFLNVGHGDCTVIEHDSGRVTVIDVNNCSELDGTSESEVLSQLGGTAKATFSLEKLLFGSKETVALEKAGYSIPTTNPIEYLANLLPKKQIFRYVQTHPDMDHMRGIEIVDRTFEVVNFWDTGNEKTIEEYSRKGDKEDWETYQRLRTGTSPKVLHLLRGSTGMYFNEGNGDLGDGIEILAPTAGLLADANAAKDWNKLSYVLRVREYGRSIILGGDAEKSTWADIHAAYGNKLSCNVLKASHHGRESGYHDEAVAAMSPGLTIVSVGKKPDTDASDSYRDHSQYVWSTRWKGDITVRIEATGFMSAQSRCDNKPLEWKVKAA